MVRETPKISCPLYPPLWFLDQPGGALVCRNYQQANSTRRVPKRERAGSGHPRIHRGAQRKSQTLRLDQNGGPNPRQHRSLRPAHVRRPTVLTYVTNHCDRRLGQSSFILKSPDGMIVAIHPYLTNSCGESAVGSGLSVDRLFPSLILP